MHQFVRTGHCAWALAIGLVTLFAVLVALLINAAPASASEVSNVSAVISSPSAAAGARTQYVVELHDVCHGWVVGGAPTAG